MSSCYFFFFFFLKTLYRFLEISTQWKFFSTRYALRSYLSPVPHVHRGIFDLKKNTLYSIIKKNPPTVLSAIFYFTLQSYSLESTGLTLKIKFLFIGSYSCRIRIKNIKFPIGEKVPEPAGSGFTTLAETIVVSLFLRTGYTAIQIKWWLWHTTLTNIFDFKICDTVLASGTVW